MTKVAASKESDNAAHLTRKSVVYAEETLHSPIREED